MEEFASSAQSQILGLAQRWPFTEVEVRHVKSFMTVGRADANPASVMSITVAADCIDSAVA